MRTHHPVFALGILLISSPASADGSNRILFFAGGDAGFTPHDHAGKLLDRDKKDGLVIGYARQPAVIDLIHADVICHDNRQSVCDFQGWKRTVR